MGLVTLFSRWDDFLYLYDDHTEWIGVEGGDSGRIRPTGETTKRAQRTVGSPRTLPNASAWSGKERWKEDFPILSMRKGLSQKISY
ncbi:malonyl CoA-acyl carrier protein transacylase [Sporosarcina newyorkensis 2681]|uniref:Malonyl CoA-acyl carrier protein transacylase n=1 Tax=Sporosarcina newyorkensis 2681 TaxID=1027292 RepID=F9DVA0_9BACL|nr:malonyl CoA-acyl carrier protein transacylase [Sporosarcina newyorkensis 2681]